VSDMEKLLGLGACSKSVGDGISQAFIIVKDFVDCDSHDEPCYCEVMCV